MLIIIALFFFQLTTKTTATYVSNYPLCTPLFFDENSNLDLQKTLYNCATNIPGSLDPPSYYPIVYNTSIYGPTNVSTHLVVNTLISVDDISAQISMDFYLRLM